MDRPDGPDVAATPPAFPAAGTPGFFTDGDEVLGPEPTVVRAWHLHSLFEEIRNVIVAAGITPVRTTLTQLRDAIRTLASPPGVMFDYAGTTVPFGFLPCDGAAVSRTTYAALFAAIGTTWGVGDGTTTFNVPDSRRRVAVGSGGTGTGTLGNAVGDVGGAETHTLTFDELPSEAKDFELFPDPINHDGSDEGDRSIIVASLTGGGGDPHNNLPPSYVVLKIIRT